MRSLISPPAFGAKRWPLPSENVEAVQKQAATLDYSMAFTLGHPTAFRLATRLTDFSPDPLNKIFFTNSGSEAADSALKIALAWHRMRGDAGRTHLIGWEKGYHGAGFGGTSVGGLGNNRRLYSMLLPGVDHLPHTHDLDHMAFSRDPNGAPTWPTRWSGALPCTAANRSPP